MTTFPFSDKLQDYLNQIRFNVSSTTVSTTSADTSSYVNPKDIPLKGDLIARQTQLPLNLTGLKPNTKYTIYDNDTDVSSKVMAYGKAYGSTTDLISDADGKLDIYYFFGSNRGASSDWSRLRNIADNKLNKLRIRAVPAGGSLSDPDVADITITTSDTNYELQRIDPDLVQSFYLDSNAVNKASAVTMTDVDLFFKVKPNVTNNISGVSNPSVSVAIIDMDSNGPIITKYYLNSLVVLPFNNIFASTDASIATKFSFVSPVQLKTDRSYGVAVIFDDPGYELWYCKTGDATVGTNIASPGSSPGHNGDLYQKTNATIAVDNVTGQGYFKELSDTDLKFNISAAKFSSNTITVDVVNQDYEFFTTDVVNGTFIGGEYVWQYSVDGTPLAYESGNVALDSTSTTISTDATWAGSLVAGDFIVVTDGTDGNTDARQVSSISNTTHLVVTEPPSFTNANAEYILTPVAKVYDFDPVKDKLYLIESSAKSGNIFEANSVVKGIQSGANAEVVTVDDYPIGSFLSDLNFNTPSLTATNVTYKFANTTYNMAADSDLDLYLPNHINTYGAIVASRSNEIGNASLYGDEDKSAHMTITFDHKTGTTNLYESPVFRTSDINILTQGWDINNDVTNEHTNNGNAKSKHISEKVNFGENNSAEDLRVYVNAYRPQGTDVKVYAKIHNKDDKESFDDKDWTLLDQLTNTNVYSALDNRENTNEYSYGFPKYPPSSTTLAGVASTDGTANVTVSEDHTSTLSVGDVIKIYDPLFADNYEIHVVDNVQTGEVTISSNFGSTNDGWQIDTLSTEHTAFTNITNDYIVRYFDKQGGQHDTYDSISIKVILTSSSSYVVPFVDDIRTVGVSA